MRRADKGGPTSREQHSPSGLPEFSSARNLLASAAPPDLPKLGAWGGQGWGCSPSAQLPPLAHTYLSRKEGAGGKGPSWLLCWLRGWSQTE